MGRCWACFGFYGSDLLLIGVSSELCGINKCSNANYGSILSADPSRIKSAECIVVLCCGALALPSFVGWVHYQVKRNKPALIPNSLWRNAAFSSACITIGLSNAVINSMELFSALL